MYLPQEVPLHEIIDSVLEDKALRVFVKREDLIHDKISGNKWRKLYYNIQYAKEKGCSTLITFGGAYSNHIAATAAAGKKFGFKTIGFIRGEEHIPLNSTLQYAQKYGMEFRYVDRATYKEKDSVSFQDKYLSPFQNYYVIPEGGTNELAVKGCEKILSDIEINFDIVCCSIGTGGTISGIINTLKEHQKAIGFPALKGAGFVKEVIGLYANNNRWELNLDYHFGGYAKVSSSLIEFINNFKEKHKIPLDPIYTGKMMYGLWNLIEKDYFSRGSVIVVIHTGGLQGIEGMNVRLKNKGLKII